VFSARLDRVKDSEYAVPVVLNGRLSTTLAYYTKHVISVKFEKVNGAAHRYQKRSSRGTEVESSPFTPLMRGSILFYHSAPTSAYNASYSSRLCLVRVLLMRLPMSQGTCLLQQALVM
jgi:hypothetical protein